VVPAFVEAPANANLNMPSGTAARPSLQ
jgi:hypothetical protein